MVNPWTPVPGTSCCGTTTERIPDEPRISPPIRQSARLPVVREKLLRQGYQTTHAPMQKPEEAEGLALIANENREQRRNQTL